MKQLGIAELRTSYKERYKEILEELRRKNGIKPFFIRAIATDIDKNKKKYFKHSFSITVRYCSPEIVIRYNSKDRSLVEKLKRDYKDICYIANVELKLMPSNENEG